MIWIKRLLGITALEEEVKNQKDLLLHQTNIIKNLEQQTNTLTGMYQRTIDIAKGAHDTVEKVMRLHQVGVDMLLPPSGTSWAVVCIKGKIDRVGFVDLSERDARKIIHFFQQYENRVIDSPFGYHNK